MGGRRFQTMVNQRQGRHMAGTSRSSRAVVTPIYVSIHLCEHAMGGCRSVHVV